MSLLRTYRYAVFASLAALLVVGLTLALGWYRVERVGGPAPSAIGGDFSLVNQHGETVTQASLAGKPSVLFFGFTFCPDVCPTTLFEMSQWLEALGRDADKLRFYFITVDPERDTREQMATYLSAFDKRIIGLTGSPEAVEAMLKAYRVFWRKVPLEGGSYTMDHTATLYVLDRQGRFVSTLDPKEPTETILAKLKRAASS